MQEPKSTFLTMASSMRSIAPVRRSMRFLAILLSRSPDRAMIERVALLRGDGKPARSRTCGSRGGRGPSRMRQARRVSILICSPGSGQGALAAVCIALFDGLALRTPAGAVARNLSASRH